MDVGGLLMSLAVSTVGFSVFNYGRKQRRTPQFVSGLALMVFPYFMDGALPMLAVACAVGLGCWLALRLGW